MICVFHSMYFEHCIRIIMKRMYECGQFVFYFSNLNHVDLYFFYGNGELHVCLMWMMNEWRLLSFTSATLLYIRVYLSCMYRLRKWPTVAALAIPTWVGITIPV